MKSGSPIEILRTGDHVDRRGQKVRLTREDIGAIAGSYDISLHEAPIVVGHPKHDDPAYGWVFGLTARGERLDAMPKDLDPEFCEAVDAGRYRKVSASLYPPESPSNPTPGSWYLRHVGFLGAQPPAVKGLRPVELSEDDEAIEIELGERDTAWAFASIADLFRKLREWIIEDKDIETADKMLPDWAVSSVERAAASAEAEAGTHFAEPQGGAAVAEPAQTADLSEKERKLAEREQKLADQEKQAAEREAAAKRQDAVEFAEEQVQAGRILPREKDGLVETLVALDGAEPVEFAEGDEAKKPHGLGEWLRGVVEGLDPRVDFTERAGGAPPAPASRTEGPAADMDPERAALDRRARDLSEKEGIDYITAVRRLGG